MFKSITRISMTLLLALTLTITAAIPAFAADTAAPSVTAKSAIAYCEDTNTNLYEKSINTRRDPLSTTKLLTAYIVMKRGIDLNKTITISYETAHTPYMNFYHLRKGERIKVRYLMYFALLPSENDAAAALGQAVAGNRKNFARIMNEEAAALGCTNSHFVNAHGCIARSHYTTAHDMALIARAAFSYSFIRKVCGTRKYTIPKTNKFSRRYLWLTNWFFRDGTYKKYNVIAGKTGTWNSYNTSLVEMSQQNGMTIYTVVLKDRSSARYSDTKKLMNYSRDILSEPETSEEVDLVENPE